MTDGNASQFVIYPSEDGQIKLDVCFVEEGELDAAATCREFRQVRTKGAREVSA